MTTKFGQGAVVTERQTQEAIPVTVGILTRMQNNSKDAEHKSVFTYLRNPELVNFRANNTIKWEYGYKMKFESFSFRYWSVGHNIHILS